MRLKSLKGSRGPELPAGIELDMTPVMNMLLILIPLLVSMAVFTQLAVIRFSLPASDAATEAPPPTERKEVDITLFLGENGFQLIGEGRKLDPVPKFEERYNFPQLAILLQKLKREYPQTESLVMLVDTAVVYEDVIATMDLCRENLFPNVALSAGFAP